MITLDATILTIFVLIVISAIGEKTVETLRVLAYAWREQSYGWLAFSMVAIPVWLCLGYVAISLLMPVFQK